MVQNFSPTHPRINPNKGENIDENSTRTTQFTEGSIPKRIELEMLKTLKHFSVVYGRPIKPKNLDLLDTHANDLNSDNK